MQHPSLIRRIGKARVEHITKFNELPKEWTITEDEAVSLYNEHRMVIFNADQVSRTREQIIEYVKTMTIYGMKILVTSERRTAQQGHLYEYQGARVIAMNSGAEVEVAIIHDPWLGQRMDVRAEDLEPLPMVYFHGEVPS